MIKIKFLPILICLILIFGLSTSSFASIENETKNESNQKIKVVDDFSNIPIVKDLYGEFIGNMSFDDYLHYLYGDFVPLLASINGVVEEKALNFTHFLQGTSPWGPVKLLKGTTTISLSGCALTSATMAMNYLGYADNPLIFNNKLLPFQPDNQASMYWSNVSLAYPGVKILFSSFITDVSNYYTSVDGIYTTVRGQIRQNRPVILGMINGDDKTHFVIARRILETEYNPEVGSIAKKNIFIYDPGVNNYTSLEQYFNAGYKVRTLLSYSK